MPETQRVVILGGGFAGVYTAKQLLKRASEELPPGRLEVSIVNRNNYMVFQPMLAEVLSGAVGLADTVSPLRRLAPGASIHMRDVESVDLENRRVICSPGFKPRALTLPYDHLVFALGNVTDFRGMTGLAEHAKPFKTLGDALALRNHVIHVLEEANEERNPDSRKQLLTFVVAGGGFSGVECIAEMHDFVRRAIAVYRNINLNDCQFILVHSQTLILPEVDHTLASYSQELLHSRGIELWLEMRLTSATANEAIVVHKKTKETTRVPTKTLVSTVPSHPNAVIEALSDRLKEIGAINDRGKLQCEGTCRLKGSDHLWALGDFAMVPLPADDGEAPLALPTAQHAIREAAVLGDNIIASVKGEAMRDFNFPGLGSLAALGNHRGVAQVMGMRFSGILAWMMWRFIYWAKMPGLDTKIRVGIAWFLDLFLPPALVQLRTEPTSGIAHEHFEPGHPVFEEGDLGDRVYVIIDGEAEVVKHANDGAEEQIATLGPGEIFGEMALLHRAPRSATVRPTDSLDVLSIQKGDFNALLTHLEELRGSFEKMAAERKSRNEERRGGGPTSE